MESSFHFGELTVGGCESMVGTLVNRGPILASLHLDLSHFPEFHVRDVTEAAWTEPGKAPTSGAGMSGGKSAPGGNER